MNTFLFDHMDCTLNCSCRLWEDGQWVTRRVSFDTPLNKVGSMLRPYREELKDIGISVLAEETNRGYGLEDEEYDVVDDFETEGWNYR